MPLTLVEKTVPQYEAMLQAWHDEGAQLYCTFGHHCWKPNGSTYRPGTAVKTVRGIQTTHINSGVFSDIACHVYVTPDGTVVPARPPTTWNCACQAPSRPWSDLPQSLQALITATRGNMPWTSWPNAYGGSVEIIGCFDWPHPEKPDAPPSEDPRTSVAFSTGLDVLAAFHRIWGIPVEHAYFHRDVEYKTCPGERVEREWYRDEIRRRIGQAPADRPMKIIGGVGETPAFVIDNARLALEEGVLRGDVRPLYEAAGWLVEGKHVKTQGKAYITPTVWGIVKQAAMLSDGDLADLAEQLATLRAERDG
jgi:hypothetical protein